MKIGGNKGELVDRIYKYKGDDSARQSKIDQALAAHKVAVFSSTALQYENYKENFNMTDRVNKRWYKFDYKFKVTN